MSIKKKYHYKILIRIGKISSVTELRLQGSFLIQIVKVFCILFKIVSKLLRCINVSSRVFIINLMDNRHYPVEAVIVNVELRGLPH